MFRDFPTQLVLDMRWDGKECVKGFLSVLSMFREGGMKNGKKMFDAVPKLVTAMNDCSQRVTVAPRHDLFPSTWLQYA